MPFMFRAAIRLRKASFVPTPNPGTSVETMVTPAVKTASSRIALAACADVTLIIIFATIGRDAHQRGESFAGVLATAWPFLAGAAIGWLAIRAWRAPLRVWPTAVIVWIAAVAGGMIFRAATGQGVAPAFVVVALITLGIFLVGYRAVLALLNRLKRRGTGRALG